MWWAQKPSWMLWSKRDWGNGCRSHLARAGGRATRVFRLLPSVTVTTTPAKPGENNGSGDGDTPDLAEINRKLAEAADGEAETE